MPNLDLNRRAIVNTKGELVVFNVNNPGGQVVFSEEDCAVLKEMLDNKFAWKAAQD